jgi:hypothetical protein
MTKGRTESRMGRPAVKLAGTAVAVAATFLAGCSSSSGNKTAGVNTAAANKATFCQHVVAFNNLGGPSTTPTQALQLAKANTALTASIVSSAPSDIKADAQTAVNGLDAAVKANSITPFLAPDVQAAGNRMNAYCGLNSNGAPTTPAP